MDKKQFTGKNALLYVLQKLKEKLSTKVDKEHKTGSESEYKVLSDNNLTDELVQKIQDAGSSTFNGEYNSLDGIPTLDGKEIKGTLTSEELGLAKSSDIPTDYVSDEELEQKGYQTSSDVESAITSKGYQTQAEVEATIATKVSSVMTYKGTVDNYSDLENYTDTAKTGDTYNITNASEHNEAGDNATFNGSSWDVLSGTIDLSAYIKNTDLEEISNSEIDGLFTTAGL